jgi:hypothetical protein
MMRVFGLDNASQMEKNVIKVRHAASEAKLHATDTGSPEVQG